MLLHTCAVPHKPACLLCSLPVYSGFFRCVPVYPEFLCSIWGIEWRPDRQHLWSINVHCLHRAALLGVPCLDLRGNRLQ